MAEYFKYESSEDKGHCYTATKKSRATGPPERRIQNKNHSRSH
jgi:hypothetical protein